MYFLKNISTSIGHDSSGGHRSFTSVFRQRNPKMTITQLWDFSNDEIERRCGHDWDCCGCWFTRVYGIKKKGNLVYFKSYSAQNY